MAEVRYATCNLCDALCGLRVTVENNRVVEVRGNPEDVLSHGHICPKGPALRELHEDPDRLRTPMRRTSTGWEPLGWDEALAETAARLRTIHARDGKDAIAFTSAIPPRTATARASARRRSRSRSAHATASTPTRKTPIPGCSPACRSTATRCRSRCPTWIAPTTSSSSAPIPPRPTEA